DDAGQLAKEGVGDVRHNQAEQRGPAGAQTSGQRVGPVPQLLDGRHHPPVEFPGDRSAAGEHAGYGADGNTGLFSHIPDGYPSHAVFQLPRPSPDGSDLTGLSTAPPPQHRRAARWILKISPKTFSEPVKAAAPVAGFRG